MGARVVDGHRFEVEAAGERGPLLVAQCDSLDVLSAVPVRTGRPTFVIAHTHKGHPI